MNATLTSNHFYSENQTMTFSYNRFPVNKINVEKIFEIMIKLLFNYYLYSHPEIGKFQGVTDVSHTQNLLKPYWSLDEHERSRNP
jgi:hypothetical protein